MTDTTPELPRARILIVDDDPAARELLEARLVPDGHEVVTAENGAEALETARRIVPDVILCDVMMPGMDGFEVCRRLRDDDQLAHVPFILVTALDDRESRLQGLRAGADDFVSKPYDGAELRARVRTISRLDRYRRLLAERAKFEWVVDHAEDGFLQLEDDVVVYANDSARIYLGRMAGDQDALAGRRFLDVAAGQYRREPAEAWESWPEPSPLPRYLVRPETPTSGAFWLGVELFDLPSERGPTRLVRLRDRTSEMALHRDVWKFNAMVAHKLRTPMTVILGSLDLLGQDIGSASQEEIADIFEMASRGARRLKDELLGILDFVSAPGLASSDVGFDLATLGETLETLAAGFEVAPPALVAEPDPPAGRLALSTPAFELVLREILGNARKFHPAGSPRVEARLAAGADVDGRRAVELEIADDGGQVPTELLGRVWSPYFQSEKGFSGNVQGMGLGLSKVATLVWGVGGRCRLRNRPEGAGVVVELVIPLAT